MKTAFSTAALSGAAAATLQALGIVRLKAFNVKDYGAFGDGASHQLSTQYGTLPLAQLVWPEATALSNEIDRLAATRALNAMPATGGTLYFPQGTYMTDGVPLTRAINNVRIAGAGSSGSVIKWAAGIVVGGAVTANAVEITSVSGWKVEDLCFDTNAANNATDNISIHWHPVYLTNSDHCAVRRCKAINALSNAVLFASGSYNAVEDNWFDGGNLYNASSVAMSEGGIRVFSDHTSIRRNHVLNWWKECYVDAGSCVIENNYLVHGTVRNGDDNGIEVYAPTNQGLTSPRSVIRNNVIENVWWEGIQIGGSSDNTVCEGNIVRSSYAMLPAAPAAPGGTATLVAGNVDAGSHFYAYTDVVAGVESKLSPASVAIVNDGTHQQNSVTGIAAGPAGTTARKVYRNKVAGSATGPWFLLTTINDNVTTTYTDNTADTSLGAQLAQTGGFAGAATIQGQTVGGGSIGILIAAAGAIVRGNQIDGWHRGIWGINSQTDTSSTLLQSINAQIVNNHIYNCVQQDADQMYGIVAGGDDPLVSGNTVEAAPILVSAVNRPLVHHNKVRSSPVFGISILNSQDVTCSGNEADLCAGHGVWINNSDTTLRRATVSNNLSRGHTNNGYGVLLSWVSFGAVVGNVCTGNAGMGLATQTCDHVTVSGNTATGNQYGFRDNAFAGNSDFITVIGNELRGNSTAATLRGTGANSVYRSNGGYNPVGVLGPPAVPATTVAYTNAYGVDATVFVTGGTVTGIAIGGTATGLTSGAFRVPAGQTIAITWNTTAPTWTWFGD